VDLLALKSLDVLHVLVVTEHSLHKTWQRSFGRADDSVGGAGSGQSRIVDGAVDLWGIFLERAAVNAAAVVQGEEGAGGEGAGAADGGMGARDSEKTSAKTNLEVLLEIVMGADRARPGQHRSGASQRQVCAGELRRRAASQLLHALLNGSEHAVEIARAHLGEAGGCGGGLQERDDASLRVDSAVVSASVGLLHSQCPIQRLSGMGVLRAAARSRAFLPLICRHLRGETGIMAALAHRLAPPPPDPSSHAPHAPRTVFDICAVEFMGTLALNSPPEGVEASDELQRCGSTEESEEEVVDGEGAGSDNAPFRAVGDGGVALLACCLSAAHGGLPPETGGEEGCIRCRTSP